LEVLKVDVFTDQLYTGNQAGVVLDADTVDESLMQRFASEIGSPVTAFIMKSRRADLRVKYFSPSSEEPLSCHASLGAVWALVEQNELGGIPATKHRLESPVGVLPFTVEEQGGGPRRVWMTLKRPLFAKEGDVKQIASALGVGADTLFHEQFPISRVSAGVPYLVVPIRSIELMAKLEPRKHEIVDLSRELEVAGIQAFTWGVLEEGSTVHARCFVARADAMENPGSGTAAGALGSYLVEGDFITKDKFGSIVIEQGHLVGRPSKIHVRAERRSGTIHRLEVGGCARISMRGRMMVE
jgi:PhzF family phenazine biosynthesis protein